MASTVQPPPDSTATWSRTARNGQKISYRMTVVQHPTQARACGLGSKSNTDRRPVDPPPIIELRVYEGDGSDMSDITFAYRANFFVWASLEYARPMAHARGSHSSANTPVLCGTPVAGTSYLDRPNPAGYFIFPDLSVRHEGNYRIKFTLYEDLKDNRYEDDSLSHLLLDAGSVAECVNCRCEVKSAAFQVYSAKKFPGLQESTSLSRTVAEQGCRVRIRRDVRMRKRDTKSSRDWDDFEDETAEQRLRHAATPNLDPSMPNPPTPSDPADARPRLRSNSVSSVRSVQPHPPSVSQPVQDWLSQDTSRSYPGTGHPSAQVQSPISPYYYHGPRASQEPPPISTYVPAQYLSDQSIAHSPQTMANPNMGGLGIQAPGPWSYGAQHQIQSSVYGQPMNHLRQHSVQYPPPSPHDYQPPNSVPTQYDTPISQNPAHFAMPEGDPYGRQTQAQHSYSNGRHTPMASQLPTPYATELPPLRHSASQPSFDRGHYESIQYPQSNGYVPPAAPPAYVSQSSAPTAQKRSYGSVFSSQSIEGPLRSGARPDTYSVGANNSPDNHSSDDDSFEVESQTMTYRRADGTIANRVWPAGS